MEPSWPFNKAARATRTKCGNGSTSPSAYAQLGGFLARKSDGEPRTQTLWRGLQRMDDITAAFRSFRTAYPMPP